MQTIQLDMINNAVQTAKSKLAQHRIQGSNSQLSIVQVAQLMDMIRRGDDNSSETRSVYFSLN